MPGVSRGWTPAHSFAVRLVAWSLVWFGLVRLEWVEAHLLLPLTGSQGWLATRLLGAPAMPIEVTLACSGADVLGLCLGAVCAYPATWRMRVCGAAGGLALIMGLNTLRIGSLGRVAASPSWFEALHVYFWPVIFTLGVGSYVFAWIRMADRHRQRIPDGRTAPKIEVRPTWRFVVLAGASIVIFAALSPLYLQSAGILSVAAFVARTGARSLRLLGIDASAAVNVLWTSRGSVMVTQECISTPLIPLYVAAVVSYSRSWHGRAVGLAATAPIFVGLGTVRLLVIALPPTLVASPLWLVHAFYQLLLGAVVVCIAACWRHDDRGIAARRALGGIALGFTCLYVSGPASSQAIAWIVAPLDDPQGAMTFFPSFQAGLYVALWAAAFAGMGWRFFVAGFALLVFTQVASLFALLALASQFGIAARIADVRAWAVMGPLLVFLLLQAVKGRRARGLKGAPRDLAHA